MRNIKLDLSVNEDEMLKIGAKKAHGSPSALVTEIVKQQLNNQGDK